MIFVPPLLYWSALTISLREMRTFLGPILRLATGLVIVTMCAVAAVVHFLAPSVGWPEAFVLGAIVSPPDPVAAARDRARDDARVHDRALRVGVHLDLRRRRRPSREEAERRDAVKEAVLHRVGGASRRGLARDRARASTHHSRRRAFSFARPHHLRHVWRDLHDARGAGSDSWRMERRRRRSDWCVSRWPTRRSTGGARSLAMRKCRGMLWPRCDASFSIGGARRNGRICRRSATGLRRGSGGRFAPASCVRR